MHNQLILQELAASYHLEPHLSRRDNSVFRISSIGDCTRKIWYRINAHRNEEPQAPIWTHGRTIFEVGTAMHLVLQHRLSNAGALKWVDGDPVLNEHGMLDWEGNFEITFRHEELNLVGHADALTRPLKKKTTWWKGQELELIEPTTDDDPEGVRYLIDFKTITAREKIDIEQDESTGTIYRAGTQPSSFERLTKMKKEHAQQASLYAWLTTQPGFRARGIDKPLPRVPEVMIVYVAKDLNPEYYERYSQEFDHPKGLMNAPFKVFTEPVDPETIEKLIKKIQKVWKHVNAGTPPTKDYYHTEKRTAWPCVYCEWNRDCYAEKGFFQEAPLPVPARLDYQEHVEVPRLLGKPLSHTTLVQLEVPRVTPEVTQQVSPEVTPEVSADEAAREIRMRYRKLRLDDPSPNQLNETAGVYGQAVLAGPAVDSKTRTKQVAAVPPRRRHLPGQVSR